MAPILGIYASQISGHLFAPSGAYDSIATVTVGAGGAGSVSFSSIPSTYTHLQIRYIARSNESTNNNIAYSFNSDGAANYSDHTIFADGSSVSAFANANSSNPIFLALSNSARLASTYSAGVFDLLDYANTNKYKTTRILSGREDNSAGALLFASGSWRNTAAVNNISLAPSVGSFVQYSQFALYGIKGN
jgi:hypothetical protein